MEISETLFEIFVDLVFLSSTCLLLVGAVLILWSAHKLGITSSRSRTRRSLNPSEHSLQLRGGFSATGEDKFARSRPSRKYSRL